MGHPAIDLIGGFINNAIERLQLIDRSGQHLTNETGLDMTISPLREGTALAPKTPPVTPLKRGFEKFRHEAAENPTFRDQQTSINRGRLAVAAVATSSTAIRLNSTRGDVQIRLH
jgi:hypothetical protein